MFPRVTTTEVQYLSSNVTTQRAGIILYTLLDGTIYFGMALDRQFHQLTDFGGGVKRGENPINAALREFHEETLNIFQPLTIDDIKQCLAMYDNNDNLLIFVRTDLSPQTVSYKYLQAFQFHKKHYRDRIENCAITWVSQSDIQRMIKTHSDSLFSRVSLALYDAGNFYSYL